MFRALPTPGAHVILDQSSKFPTRKNLQVRVSCRHELWGASHSVFFETVWKPLSGEGKRTMKCCRNDHSRTLEHIKKLLGRGNRSQFLFHLKHFHRPFKGSYCNWDKYLEISSHKRKLQQILKDEERQVNSQWTMQNLLSVTCSSTRTLPYWADESDSSICLSKHSS